MTEEEMDRLAVKIANAKGALAGVTPANARERLTNLIHHDREWAGRVSAGEVVANDEFHKLTRMIADHQEATQKLEVETATAALSKEAKDKADAEAAKAAEIAAAVANLNPTT